MAKRRDERYASTADLLEDLKAVHRGEPPVHARRAIDLDTLAAVEATGKTVDITPDPGANVWSNPMVIAVLTGLGVSVIVNLLLLLIVLSR